jgi:hypothetical protein
MDLRLIYEQGGIEIYHPCYVPVAGRQFISWIGYVKSFVSHISFCHLDWTNSHSRFFACTVNPVM